jgi:hypothetical protein
LAHDPHLQYEYEALFGIGRLKQAFWDHQDLENDPRWRCHPLKQRPNFMNKAIVVNYHGDGAQFQVNDSLVTVSFSGMVKDGATLDTNLFLASWPKHNCATRDGGTWDTIWAWLVWDANQLFYNKYNEADPWGGPLPEHLRERAGKQILPDDYFVVVGGLSADLDYQQNDLGLPNKGCLDPNPCCGYCHGNKTTNNWFNFQPGAEWKKTPPRDPYTKHVISKIIGFTVWHFYIDWLHTVDFGVASHAVANVLWDTVFVKLKDERRALAVQQVGADIMSFATEHGSALSHFDLNMFINPKKMYSEYPLMNHVKAAQIRGMIPAVLHIAKKYSSGSRMDRHRVRMMESLAAMYDIVHCSGIAISSSSYTAFAAAADKFLLTYTAPGRI